MPYSATEENDRVGKGKTSLPIPKGEQKVNEKNKIIISLAAVLCCIGIAWYLFSIPSTGGTNNNRVEQRLDDTAREQQKAGDSLAEVRRGIDDSAASVDRIDSGIADDAERAGTIQDRTADAEASADSIAERNERITDELADAESRNAEAAAAIDDATRAISDCSQLNRDSAEIFRRYAGRNTGK